MPTGHHPTVIAPSPQNQHAYGQTVSWSSELRGFDTMVSRHTALLPAGWGTHRANRASRGRPMERDATTTPSVTFLAPCGRSEFSAAANHN